MPDGVYADAWLMVIPLQGVDVLPGDRFAVPCDDVYEARAIQQMLVKAGCPKKCFAVVGVALPPRPNGGGRYRVITVADAERYTLVE